MRSVAVQFLAIAAGGSLGAVARYSVGLFAGRVAGAGYPWGTLAVNLAGCFLIGIASGMAGRGLLAGLPARMFFITGFLGAFTTFSTYALETLQMGRTGSALEVFGAVLAHNLGGLLLVLAGMAVVRWSS